MLARMPGCYFSWVLEYEEFLAKKTGTNSPGYTGYKGKIHAESGRGPGIKETRWKEAVGYGCKDSEHSAMVLNMLLWSYISKNLRKVFKREW